MFRSARVRLTFLYLLIIALISISFSGIIYNDFVSELESRLIHAESRFQGLSIPRIVAQKYLEEELAVAKKVVILRLMFLNGAILFVSGIGGYYLAGKTLFPIEEVMEEQKRFVADASHELRTPLTSLKTEIEVALRDKKITLKSAKELLKSNLSEIDKMKDLAYYLLSLSRYESGQGITMETVSLPLAVNEAIGKNLNFAKNKRISIKKNLKDVNIQGNYAGLVELFSILINNAISYGAHGKSVEVRVKRSRRCAVVEVEDHGAGIEEKDLPHIFDRFYRADQSRCKDAVEGYGLGLSIAKSIADLHRAAIKTKSKLGKGTKFSVNFPLYF